MPLPTLGYCGRILHIELATGQIEIESPPESFYRAYLGGSAMGTHYLLKHTSPGCDPLGPENMLCIMTGVITGAPISGQSRVLRMHCRMQAGRRN